MSLIVRSFSPRRKHAKAFTCMTIPGFQTVSIEDERAVDKYIKEAERRGLISAKRVENTVKRKEE